MQYKINRTLVWLKRKVENTRINLLPTPLTSWLPRGNTDLYSSCLNTMPSYGAIRVFEARAIILPGCQIPRMITARIMGTNSSPAK